MKYRIPTLPSTPQKIRKKHHVSSFTSKFNFHNDFHPCIACRREQRSATDFKLTMDELAGKQLLDPNKASPYYILHKSSQLFTKIFYDFFSGTIITEGTGKTSKEGFAGSWHKCGIVNKPHLRYLPNRTRPVWCCV